MRRQLYGGEMSMMEKFDGALVELYASDSSWLLVWGGFEYGGGGEKRNETA